MIWLCSGFMCVSQINTFAFTSSSAVSFRARVTFNRLHPRLPF